MVRRLVRWARLPAKYLGEDRDVREGNFSCIRHRRGPSSLEPQSAAGSRSPFVGGVALQLWAKYWWRRPWTRRVPFLRSCVPACCRRWLSPAVSAMIVYSVVFVVKSPVREALLIVVVVICSSLSMAGAT